MSDAFDDFMNEMSGAGKGKKKTDLEFSIARGTDLCLASHVPHGIPSRIPQLDLSLGRPGYPAGRSVELYGVEMSGKSTVALAAIAAAQRKGGTTLWIDAEYAWDPAWAAANGCDPERVMVAEADTVEGLLNVQAKALEAKAKMDDQALPFVMVVDSITAVPSLESIAKEFGEVQRIGTDAKAIRNGMRKLTKDIAENNALAIYINHNTSKIASAPFAKQSQSSGGHALKFYSSLRIEVARVGTLYEGTGDDKVRKGIEISFLVEKNKVANTGKAKVKCKLLNNGFDIYENLWDAMVDIGELEKVNQRSYHFVPTKTTLERGEWQAFIDDQSGIEETYNWFLRRATEKGFIRPYGT
jgi:recombination protein RecA